MHDLTGAAHVLPADLPADPCVVAMVFRQTQQRDIDAWAEALEGLPFIELPVLPPLFRVMRGWLERGMASDTPAHVQPRVWVTYARLKAVIADMGGHGHREALIAVVRRSGEVVAEFRGEPSPGSVMAVKTALGAR